MQIAYVQAAHGANFYVKICCNFGAIFGAMFILHN